jgi:putative nucleotidyltransferase with HDIG domain
VWRIVTKPVDPKTLTSVCIRAIEEWKIRRRTEALEAQVRILSEILPRCIEANDPMTAGHSERVVGYAEALARHCRLDEADLESLRLASLLHDIGKIGIPERILSKRGPLDASERDIIKQHPRLGFEILEPLRGQDKARLWVYQHHERWDGKGYPEGLAGEDVELGGRILILAEVYDALRSARSYKEGWDVPRIAEFFRQQAGTQFDPALSHLVADGLERRGPSFLANQPSALF